jgi:hypothetical protein
MEEEDKEVKKQEVEVEVDDTLPELIDYETVLAEYRDEWRRIVAHRLDCLGIDPDCHERWVALRKARREEDQFTERVGRAGLYNAVCTQEEDARCTHIEPIGQ